MELLVVIAIIGILVALLLPAVQAAREAARRNQCKNNLKQLSLGCLLHEDTHKALPSGGWSKFFTADPNMGFGPDQPGSWYYSVLSYIEEQALRDLGKGLALTAPGFQPASLKLHQTPVPMFHCPSRRTAKLYPQAWGTLTEQSWVATVSVVKGDYAANSGDSLCHAGNGFGSDQFTNPSSTAAVKNGTFSGWTPTNKATGTYARFYQTGVIYYRSDISSKRITDGTSHTYLIGERFMSPDAYEELLPGGNGRFGDNQGVYAGYEWENHRVAYKKPNTDGPGTAGSPYAAEDYQPRRDIAGADNPGFLAFGSAHAGSMNMAMCDGSVQGVSYDIDSDTHGSLANRLDGKVCDFAAVTDPAKAHFVGGSPIRFRSEIRLQSCFGIVRVILERQNQPPLLSANVRLLF